MLLSVGGPDLEDIIMYQSGITLKDDPGLQANPGRAEIPADAANGIIGQAYEAEIPRVIGRPAKNATTWAEGIRLIKAAIGKYSNEVMERFKLMLHMPVSNYSDWRKCGQELLEQAK